MNKPVLLLLALASVGGGCTMAPKYARPTPSVPGAWPTGAAYTENQAPASVPLAIGLRWWPGCGSCS